jgi:hypothetical protein
MIQAATFRQPLAARLFQAILLTAVCLPTRSIFGLNVKVPISALFSLAFVLYLGTHSSEWLTSAEFIVLGLFSPGLCFWALIAILHGESETRQIFSQLKDIASTVAGATFGMFMVRFYGMRNHAPTAVEVI